MPRRVYYNDPPNPQFDPTGLPEVEVRKEFARRLSRALKEKGWTQSELARRMRVGRDNVSGYVRGKSLPGPTMLRKLEVALGVDTDYLIPRAPGDATGSVDRTYPQGLSVRFNSDLTQAWIEGGQIVTSHQARRIIEILAEPKADAAH